MSNLINVADANSNSYTFIGSSNSGHKATKSTVKHKLGVSLIKTGLIFRKRIEILARDERGDVPGWVLVVLMTTGLVTAIWAIAKPNLTNILSNSLSAMNGVK